MTFKWETREYGGGRGYLSSREHERNGVGGVGEIFLWGTERETG